MKLWILSPNRPQNHTITGANVLIFLLETYFVDTRYIRTIVNFREDDVLKSQDKRVSSWIEKCSLLSIIGFHLLVVCVKCKGIPQV